MRSLLVLLFLVSSCSKEEVLLKLKHGTLKDEGEAVAEVTEGTKSLFCFKCHSYDKFLGKTGRFPHEKHRGLYHCNQCHELRMHQSIRTDTAVCKDCHPGVFVMKRGMNKMTMDDINKGQSCWVCHNGKKAFLTPVFKIS